MKMYLFIQLFMIGAIFQGLFGAAQTDKTLSVQKQENERNRQYNLQLAKMQNEWNLKQWERENEYNNPLNQMQRLKAAGLNPNLVYGNGAGQSTAAPSPQLTSGSPSMPQDMSLMNSRPTIGTIMAQGLQNEMVRAQIDATKATSRKTLAEAGITEIEQRALNAIEQINGVSLDSASLPPEWKNNPIISARLAEFEKAVSDAKASSHFANIQSYKEFEAEIDKRFKSEKVEYEVALLAKALDIKKDEAEFIAKTLSSRIKGVSLDVQNKEYETLLNSPELIKKLPEGIKPLVSLLNLIFRGH